MSQDLLTFTTETIAGGVRYVLPRRVLGAARYGGLVMAGMGLIITLFMCVWMGMPMLAGIEMINDGEWFGLALIGFGLLGLFGMIPGLGMLFGGLAVWANKTRPLVEVRDGKLIAIERLGPFKWKRKRNIEKIRQLSINHGLASKHEAKGRDQVDPVEFFPDDSDDALYVLEATGEGMKPMKVLAGYPTAILRPLADALADRVNLAGPAKLFDDEDPAIAVVEQDVPDEEGEDDAAIDERVAAEQPQASKIALEQRDDGLTLTVPPTGIWKSSAGLFSFGLIWTVFCCLIFGGMGMAFLFGEGEGPDSAWEGLFIALFALVFFAVGVGMLLAGWNMGKRRAVIDVVGEMLVFSELAPLKTRQMEWRTSEIQSIAMGPSGIESNDVPIMCLLIAPRDGKTVKLLTGRPDEELEWVTALLRIALKKSLGEDEPRPVPTDETGELIQPTDSRIGVDRTSNAVTFAVPARGIRRNLPALFIGGLFALVGLGVWIGVSWHELADGFKWSDLLELGFISLWALLFGGGGAAILIGTFISSRRRYLIEVVDGQIVVQRFGPLGKRKRQWQASEIREVSVKFNGTQTGDHKHHEVQIEPRNGKTFKIGAGRAKDELHWLAAAIKAELRR